MKKAFLVAVLILIKLNTFAQWQWAKKGGGNRDEGLSDMCIDASGNVYIYGFMEWLGGGIGSEPYAIFGTDTVFNDGANQIYIVKYSGSNGNVLWSKGIGANNPFPTGGTCFDCEYSQSIIYDPVGNCLYATGTITGLASFDTTVINGSRDLFLTKMGLSGNYVWTKLIKIRNANSIFNSSMTTDGSGNIYLSVNGKDSITFGNIKKPKGQYIAKYNSSGSCLWAKNKFIGCDITDIKYFNKKLYVAGRSVNDTIMLDNISHVYKNLYNLFVAKFDTGANISWANYGSSSYNEVVGKMGVDNKGNCYVEGSFSDSLYIGSSVLTTTNTTYYNAHLAKWDSSGNFVWARQSNSPGGAGAKSISTSSNGFSYLTGVFSGNATFGSYSVSAAGATDVYIARYDSSGYCMNVLNVGFNGNNGYDLSIVSNSSDEYFISTSFTGSVVLSTTLTCQDVYGDVLVAKHDAITDVEERHLNANNNTLLIYANPTAGKCNISIPDDFLYENNLTLQVYDVMGRLLQNAKIEVRQDEIKLNLEAEAKGVYNVILSNGKKNYTGKIIFE